MGIDAVTALQQNLDSQIERQINPTSVTLPAPWANPPIPPKPQCVLLSAVNPNNSRTATLTFTAPYSNIFLNVTRGGTTNSLKISPTESEGKYIYQFDHLGIATTLFSVYAEDDLGNRTADSNTLGVNVII